MPNQPTVAQIRAVSACFRAISAATKKSADGAVVDMQEGVMVKFSHWSNREKHPCSTVACHGGWYALGKGLVGFWGTHDDWPDDMQVYHQPDGTVGRYIQGAQMMAEDLGFESKLELEIWAAQHPEWWGNDFGSYMFNSIRAFLPVGVERREIDVEDLGDWWEAVAARREAAEIEQTTLI